MGCPDLHYKEMMVEYIRICCGFSKLSKYIDTDFLMKQSISELESMVKCFHKDNIDYARFTAGVAVANVLCMNEDNNDALNAACGSCCMFEELFGIEDKEEIITEETIDRDMFGKLKNNYEEKKLTKDS